MLSLQQKYFRKTTIAIAIGVAIATTTLSGCSGKEARQAKYLQRAQQYLDKNEVDKARIEAKNVLQINANNAEARYVLAELEERAGNWQQMFANINAALEADPNLIKAHVKLAQLMIASNQIDKAEEEEKKIRALQADNADAFAIEAAVAIKRDKSDEAIAAAKAALQKQPGHLGATVVLATVYANSEPDKAETVLLDSIKLHPQESNLQLLLARVYAKQNKTDKTIDVFKQLIEQHPDNLQYTMQLANLYIAQQRADDAEKLLKQRVEKNPEQVEAKLLLVEFVGKQHKPEDAVQLLEQYSSAAPDNYKLRSALARLYVGMRNTDKALQTYRYTIDKDIHGEGIDARNRTIELYLSQNKRKEAETLLADVLKLEPENAEALITRARLALIDGDANNAIADLRTVLKNAPDSNTALTLMGAAQERTGAIDLALDNYRKILDKNSNDILALMGAARIEMAQRKLDDAQKLLEHAHEINPNNIDTTRMLVDLYVRKQQWQPATDLCNQLILNSNTAPVGFHLLGLVKLQQKEIPAAIDDFKKALEKEPRAIEPLQLLATAYIANKQTDAAVSYLEKHVKTNPDQLHAQELLGAVYRQAGKLPQAEQTLCDLLQKQPALVSAYRQLMTVYVAQNAGDKVDALLKDAVAKNPKNVELLTLQAQYFQTTGRHQPALDTYNQALQLAPRAELIKNNLATLLIDHFDSEDNLRRAQTLTADFSESNNPLLIDTQGWLQYKLKNYAQAVSLLESIEKKGADFPELHYHLGMAYLKSGDNGKAKEQLTKATAPIQKAPTPQIPWLAEAEAELKKL